MSVDLKWFGNEAEKLVFTGAMARLEAAGRHLTNQIKTNISKPTWSRKSKADRKATRPKSRKKKGKSNGQGPQAT